MANSENTEAWDLEKVYDDEIFPLMGKIIEICRKHKMPMAASFAYKNDPETGETKLCTTSLPFDNRDIPQFNKAVRLLQSSEPAFAAFTVTKVSK